MGQASELVKECCWGKMRAGFRARERMLLRKMRAGFRARERMLLRKMRAGFRAV